MHDEINPNIFFMENAEFDDDLWEIMMEYYTKGEIK